METLHQNAKAGCAEARGNVISFEEYCRYMDNEAVHRGDRGFAMPGIEERVHGYGKRHKLERLCLLLEAGVCLSVILLLIRVLRH